MEASNVQVAVVRGVIALRVTLTSWVPAVAELQ